MVSAENVESRCEINMERKASSPHLGLRAESFLVFRIPHHLQLCKFERPDLGGVETSVKNSKFHSLNPSQIKSHNSSAESRGMHKTLSAFDPGSMLHAWLVQKERRGFLGIGLQKPL